MSGAAPRIRFRKFGGEWAEQLLGTMFAERTERSGEKLLLSVTMADGVIPASENGKLDNSSADKSNYKCVCPGDLAYNSMRMWQGASGASELDGIVSPAYTVLKPGDETDSFFFARMFKRPEFLKVFKAFSQGLTSDTWNLKYPLLSTIPAQVPSLPEQRSIAGFFRGIDDAIAAADARVGKLRQAKKAFLGKMFPRRLPTSARRLSGDFRLPTGDGPNGGSRMPEGQSVPEIRFKGFGGEWKWSRFGDILQATPHNLFLAKELSPFGSIDVIQQGDTPFAGLSKEESNPPFVNTADVVLFGDHTLSIFKPRRPFYLASDGLKILSVDKMPGDFLCALLTVYRPQSEGYKRHFSVLLNSKCAFPKSIAEQCRIGTFFRELDALIEAAQKKSAKLRQVKAALLEGMFA